MKINQKGNRLTNDKFVKLLKKSSNNFLKIEQ